MFMNKWNTYRALFFLAGFFFIAQTLYSQQDVDSILQKAKKQIYENPDLAIELSQKSPQQSRSNNSKQNRCPAYYLYCVFIKKGL